MVAEGVNAGLYAYDLTGLGTAGFAYTPAKEVKLSVKKITALYAVADGVVLGEDGTGMTLYNFKKTVTGEGESQAVDYTINAVKSFNSLIEVLAIQDVTATEEKLEFRAVFKRSSSEDLYSYKFSYDIEDGVYTVNNDGLEQAKRLTKTDSTATYLEAEQIGDYFYFQNKWGYVSRVKVGDLDAEAELLGKMTTADKEAYDKEMNPEEE
jgi:hypothetical protein